MKSYEIPSNLLGSKSSEIRLWAISSTIWAPRPLSAPAQRSGCCLGPRAAPGDGRWGSNEPTITAWWCNNHLEKYESQLGWFFPYMKWKIKFMFQSTNCFLVKNLDSSTLKVGPRELETHVPTPDSPHSSRVGGDTSLQRGCLGKFRRFRTCFATKMGQSPIIV